MHKRTSDPFYQFSHHCNISPSLHQYPRDTAKHHRTRTVPGRLSDAVQQRLKISALGATRDDDSTARWGFNERTGIWHQLSPIAIRNSGSTNERLDFAMRDSPCGRDGYSANRALLALAQSSRDPQVAERGAALFQPYDLSHLRS